MVSTIGITVHKHYCQNELVATSILPHGDEDACDADMPMESGHCSDEHVHFDVDSPIVAITADFDLTPSIAGVLASYVVLGTKISELNITSKYYTDANPPPLGPDIYIKVQSFLL